MSKKPKAYTLTVPPMDYCLSGEVVDTALLHLHEIAKLGKPNIYVQVPVTELRFSGDMARSNADTALFHLLELAKVGAKEMVSSFNEAIILNRTEAAREAAAVTRKRKTNTATGAVDRSRRVKLLSPSITSATDGHALGDAAARVGNVIPLRGRSRQP